jgi:asparagine synthase (glutamine-hydrolysing)
VEVRYPFLDLRVVNYLLALPPFPLFFEKSLLRQAMAGRLPEASRVRPKTPLADDPLVRSLRNAESTEWFDQVQWNSDMDRYINRSALAPLPAGSDSERISLDLRPLCLNFWLQSARGVRYNLRAEVCNA